MNIDVPAGVGTPLLNTQLFYLTKSAIWSRPAMPLTYCYYGKAQTITCYLKCIPGPLFPLGLRRQGIKLGVAFIMISPSVLMVDYDVTLKANLD